jgi:transcriptional regulator with XRE-family HTH domain
MSAEIIELPDPHLYAVRVAAKVRGAAAEQQVTNVRLAKALGLSENSMSRRMTGKQEFGIGELAAVAAVLDVPVDRLLPHLDSNQKPAGERTRGLLVEADFITHEWRVAEDVEVVAELLGAA